MNNVMQTEEEFFSELIKSNRGAHLYLLGGAKLQGWVEQETEYCILLNLNDPRATHRNTALIYKSAIASVVPIAIHGQARRGAQPVRVRDEYAA